MWLLKTKTFLKKAWVFVKEYWYMPFILVSLLFLILRSKMDKADTLVETLKASKDSYKKQVDVIEKAHKEETVVKEKNLKRYTEIVEKIEKEYRLENDKLESNKRKRIKKLVEEYHDDPESLASLLEITYGIKYVETPNESTDDNSGN